MYVFGEKNTLRFLESICLKSAGKILAQLKGEYLMLMPETPNGFRANVGALPLLSENEDVRFHTFSLPED